MLKGVFDSILIGDEIAEAMMQFDLNIKPEIVSANQYNKTFGSLLKSVGAVIGESKEIAGNKRLIELSDQAFFVLGNEFVCSLIVAAYSQNIKFVFLGLISIALMSVIVAGKKMKLWEKKLLINLRERLSFAGMILRSERVVSDFLDEEMREVLGRVLVCAEKQLSMALKVEEVVVMGLREKFGIEVVEAIADEVIGGRKLGLRVKEERQRLEDFVINAGGRKRVERIGVLKRLRVGEEVGGGENF